MNSNKRIDELKICMVVHQNYFTDARVQRYAETLAKQGAKVDIICVVKSNIERTDLHKNIRIYSIPISRNYRSQTSYLFEYAFAFFFYFIWLSFLYVQNQYDIIHVHNMPDFLVYAALLPRLMGTPVILDIHDIMPDFYMSKFNQRADSLMVKIIRLQERLSTSLSSKVITVCRGCQERLHERGLANEKILLIYNTPNPEIFNLEDYSDIRPNSKPNFTMIFPGTHAPRYGLDIPIRALPLLIPKIENIRLKIVGKKVEYTDELANLAKKLGVEQYVEFVPAVPLEKIPALLITADVGIYPAIKEPYMDLAVPEKVFEYSMMGLPIVATRLSVLEELFSNQAILFFESGQIEQFADCVLKIHQNPGQIKEMINQANLEYKQGFSWEKGKKDYFVLLDQLLKKVK